MTSRFARFLTLLFAAIQFAAPAVASVAEGSFSRRVIDPASHIEAHGQKDCLPPHAADCAMCRYLANGADHPAMAAVPLDFTTATSVAIVAQSFASSVDRQGFEARGPPATTG
jgi:hypothetical protein